MDTLDTRVLAGTTESGSMMQPGSTQEKIPRITVLMAVYNGKKYLREAIDSILGQTFTDFEFLIVDDGSTDSSQEIICSYVDPRIRLVENHENLGLTRSLNKGLSLARGEYIARQDADDISLSTRFEKQIEFLDAHPDIALLGTQAHNIDESGKFYRSDYFSGKATTKLAIKWQLLFDSAFNHTSVIFKRSVVWDQLGGYDVRFVRNQDMELWLRIAADYDVANLSDALVKSRYSHLSISRNYSPEDVIRVKDVLMLNFNKIGVDHCIASGWLIFWHQVTNPTLRVVSVLHKNALCNLNRIVSDFEMHHAKAACDKEYCNVLSSVYARVILYFAPHNKITALRWYLKLLPLNSGVAVNLIPKFFLLLFLGEYAKIFFKRLKNMLGKFVI